MGLSPKDTFLNCWSQLLNKESNFWVEWSLGYVKETNCFVFRNFYFYAFYKAFSDLFPLHYTSNFFGLRIQRRHLRCLSCFLVYLSLFSFLLFIDCAHLRFRRGNIIIHFVVLVLRNLLMLIFGITTKFLSRKPTARLRQRKKFQLTRPTNIEDSRL